MSRLSRRDLSRLAVLPLAAGCNVGSSRPNDMRLENIRFEYEDFLYRTPYMFGGRSVDRVTLLNVHCRIRTNGGKTANGFGSMTMGNQWAFPSAVIPYDGTLGAMKQLATKIQAIYSNYKEAGHPLDSFHTLEPEFLRAAADVSKELNLPTPVPKLCTLVTVSAFDAAIHDAFGKAHGRSAWQTYGAGLMTHDLSHYLNADFKGEYADRYVLAKPVAGIPIFHSVGASDPLLKEDVKKPVGDGMPETLPEWIRYNGLTHFKIKLNGGDREKDIARIIRIDRILDETLAPEVRTKSQYLLDFNEGCSDVGYLLEVLRRVKESTPNGFNRIQYIEQPTKRDLRADPSNRMHEAAKLRPVVIDESLTDLESLLLAREMGYTGVALKACKGQSHAVLMAAAAQKYKMSLCVQDLTCPGASFVHSCSIASHVPGVGGIEGNSRQYVPAANKGWDERFPGLFKIAAGKLDTSGLTGPGLGAVA
jgi:L-alanine-DL-glutamate epimerase-like enolase superfamily enzyme